MQKFRPEGNDPGLPVLKIKELGQGSCESDAERCRSDIDESVRIYDGDLVFSWSGTLLLDFWAGGDAGLNQHLFKVTSERYPSWFVYMWTKYHMRKFIALAKDRATTMGHIKRSALAEAEVLIPPADVLGKLTEQMQPVVDQMIGLKVEARKLGELRDVLLPKLMSGEIDVSKVDLTPLNNHLACFCYSRFCLDGIIRAQKCWEAFMTAWMIRAGRAGVYAADWLECGYIGIGWDFGGVDISAMSREEIRTAYESSHPGESRSKVAAAVGQINRFAHDIVRGSSVVMYDPQTRLYHVGEITGDCEPVFGVDGMAYRRSVVWREGAPRDALSSSSKNSLGSISTIFSVSDEVMGDILRAASLPVSKIPAEADAPDTDDDEARIATYDDGVERIKDRVLALDWGDMEQLVAGLLRAMGYCARVTSKGPDGGRDVIASPDALGLESPRIITEVKHRKGSMGSHEIRSFIGGLRASDRGLYVSTGGYTREARYEADRSNIPVKLLDLDEFVRLYIECYDRADEDTRAILPLVRIWWPA